MRIEIKRLCVDYDRAHPGPAPPLSSPNFGLITPVRAHIGPPVNRDVNVDGCAQIIWVHPGCLVGPAVLLVGQFGFTDSKEVENEVVQPDSSPAPRNCHEDRVNR